MGDLGSVVHVRTDKRFLFLLGAAGSASDFAVKGCAVTVAFEEAAVFPVFVYVIKEYER